MSGSSWKGLNVFWRDKWSPGLKWWMDLLMFSITFLLGGLLSALVFSAYERGKWQEQVRWQSRYSIQSRNLEAFYEAVNGYGAVAYDVVKSAYYEHNGLSNHLGFTSDERARDLQAFRGPAIDELRSACRALLAAFQGSDNAVALEAHLRELLNTCEGFKDLLDKLKPSPSVVPPVDHRAAWKAFSDDGLDDLGKSESEDVKGDYGRLRRSLKQRGDQILREGYIALQE